MAKSFAYGINHEWVDPKDSALNDGVKEQGKKGGGVCYFEKFNLNVFNKLILIVDIDKHTISNYLVHNPTQ